MIDPSSSFIGVCTSQKVIYSLHGPQYAVILPPRQRSSYRSTGEETCGNFDRMDMGEILSRISAKSKEKGLSEQGLAKAAGLSKDGIRNWRRRHEAGEENAGANVSSISKVAATLGVSELWLLHGVGEEMIPTISIAGKVGAGAQVPVFDAYTKGDGPQVECPPGLSPHGVVAVEVEGDSMEPVFSSGDLLFYTRHTHDGVPAEAIGHRCVVEDENGMGWVKGKTRR
ncbi:S24 family peptidase [Salipiger sp. H15]|uniref:S24 family peptidase n=1 Tax=Alloyangia sp. H15 TaxID=3029062 RepID=A0AAU8AQ48_9RHOB